MLHLLQPNKNNLKVEEKRITNGKKGSRGDMKHDQYKLNEL
jgi:hypothetical protein